MSALALVIGGLLVAAAGTAIAAGAAAVSRLELSRWVSERLPGAEIATALLAAPGPVIGTASGVATAGVVVAAVGLPALTVGLPPVVAVVAAIGVGIPLLVILGAIVPRAAGRRWAERVVRAASPWLKGAARVVAPFVPASAGAPRADFGRIVREADAHAASDDEMAVISGVLAFTERSVREIMTPRTEIVAVVDGAPVHEVATMFAESGYSRLPVYRDSLDNIVGLVHAFDLLRVEAGAALPLRPVTVVPASRRCADLLFELQRERRQFAVVLDEFGGTAGIVTFEDLLQELVGEIFDERGDAAASEADVTLVELPGAAPVEELAARFEFSGAERTATVGGMLVAALGRIPRQGERILLGELEFDVLAATPTRVERVVVRRAPVTPVAAGASPRPPA